ncbi:TRAP transporter small permease subunit [Chloroflexota bacterium]
MPEQAGTTFNRIIRILFVIACSLFIIGWLSVLYEVVMRYIFSRAQIWVVDIVSYILLYITFLSAAWVLSKEGHVRMDWMINRLNPRNQAFLNMVTYIISSIMWLVIFLFTAHLTWSLFLEGEHIYTGLEPLKAPLVAIIPAGSLVLVIQLLRMAHGHLKRWRTS